MCSEKLDVGAPTATTYDPNARDELAALVSSARQGDHLAWAAIVNRYSILLVSVIRSFRFEPEEARDIAQVVWLRLVEQLVNLRDPGALAGWLSTTTRNECIRRSRRQRESTPYHDLRNESANTKGPEEVALDTSSKPGFIGVSDAWTTAANSSSPSASVISTAATHRSPPCSTYR